ncbi:MAG: hypothetical protein COW11_01830 [Candidatus Omnitrophica bacterium CG12_big_fil_rev_8_21_14_0_65_43_15]|uniref:Uncharacterized protein n=1 Tax=Candidatus Taenaricola geysiri TaxID=1974752 RepID=A0A2J0LSA5_9BACT|nr:MAG: hypothetical protein AUJ89_05390 [Candidatus Omnitrophica bacterium CG1_02_43_210]PIV12339.1 MAG: hypothetical protein COS48_01195 [Candidatus Omnitrophica bacterium CG03_land_8_20_14_0_80_43_22]PIW66717.1 MAG: hypothetical protein COW11_01830 [Candidatus Omnitrophica bacterium CG12_big_fil_rev_8_21_14_0_65_43_15]PJC46557.1 MAG: hypothetical protein CO036_02200 [Candidatus Omnitrophica bacterium CG_4_9_14_0_2_um_filter_43_12]
MVKNEKGVVLILVIVLMVLAGILIFSSVTFIRESLNLAVVKQNQTKAINAAQCGIYKAVEDFKRRGYYNPETNVLIWGNEYYTTGGGAANYLQVDATVLKVEAGGKALRQINLKNISGASSMTITDVRLIWEPNAISENLTKISIGGADWLGSVNSGVLVPINYTLTAGSSTSFRVQWDVVVTSKTITCEFLFSDGSTVTAYILKNGQTAANSFTIKCTGSVVSNITWKRTIIAEYDVGTGKITSWNETNSHL